MTQKAGEVWCEITEKYLSTGADVMDAYFRHALCPFCARARLIFGECRDKVAQRSIPTFKNLLHVHVHDEKSLFCFLSRFPFWSLALVGC